MARFEVETDPTLREMVAELIALRFMSDREDHIERVCHARQHDAQLAQCFARYCDAIVQELLTERQAYPGIQIWRVIAKLYTDRLDRTVGLNC